MNEILYLKEIVKLDDFDEYLQNIGIVCNLQKDINEYQKANDIIINRIKTSKEGETKEYLKKASLNLINVINRERNIFEDLELKIENYIQQENIGGNK